ncbi:hypothetical protein FXO38_23559 [Capsicum annuum]|nr:hypothetical protein FXO38_23559 [Capsicum annuum]
MLSEARNKRCLAPLSSSLARIRIWQMIDRNATLQRNDTLFHVKCEECYEVFSSIARRNNYGNPQQATCATYLLEDEFSLYCSSLSSAQRIEEEKNLIVLLTVNHGGVADYIVVMIAWRLSGFLTIVIKTIYFCYGTSPATRESIVLPDPEFSSELCCTWGLGYESVSDDYKILKIDEKACSEILALKSGSWR